MPSPAEAQPEPPTSSAWHDAIPAAELPEGSAAEALVAGNVIALAHAEGNIYAMDGICAHQAGPVGKGKLEGCTLTCPWHGWQYDVRDGQQKLSRVIRQRTYATRVVSGTIQVQIEAS